MAQTRRSPSSNLYKISMKILEINTVCGEGSTGNIAVEIAHCIKQVGATCYIAYGHGYSNYEPSFRIGNNIEQLIHKILSRLFDFQGLGSVWGTINLLKIIKQEQIDLIHIHNIHGNYLNYKILLRYIIKKKIPVVLTLHDCWTITGHCAHFIDVNCTKWQTGCFRCPKKRLYPASLTDFSKRNYNLKRTLFTHVNQMHIITVSDWLREIIKQSYLAKFPIDTIHNGVDLTIFYPRDTTIKKNIKQDIGCSQQYMILAVGTKGLQDIIKLSQLLSNEYKIVIIGATDQSHNKKLHFIPPILDKLKLAEYYSAADCFINPTYADTFPTTNLEALACGTPIITYRTGGSVEAITPQTGKIVEKGDLQGIIAAIHSLEKENQELLSKHCRLRAETYFDKKLCFSKYIDIYKRLLKK